MDICYNGHEEIAYAGKNCPMCILLEEIYQQRNIIEQYEKEISELKRTNEEQQTELESINKTETN